MIIEAELILQEKLALVYTTSKTEKHTENVMLRESNDTFQKRKVC